MRNVTADCSVNCSADYKFSFCVKWENSSFQKLGTVWVEYKDQPPRKKRLENDFMGNMVQPTVIYD